MGSVHPKVGGTALAGAVVVILLYLVKTLARIDVPPDVAAAVTTVIGFVIGYLVPSPQAPAAQVVPINNARQGTMP